MKNVLEAIFSPQYVLTGANVAACSILIFAAFKIPGFGTAERIMYIAVALVLVVLSAKTFWDYLRFGDY